MHTLKFIADADNALLIGKPGTGKIHIAKAIAYNGTLQGMKVRYVESDTVFAGYAVDTRAIEAMPGANDTATVRERLHAARCI